MILKCAFCSKEFNKNYIYENKKYCCSRDCANSLHSQQMTGKKNSNYKNARVVVKCPICQKDFETWANEPNRRTFCSKSCGYIDLSNKQKGRPTFYHGVREKNPCWRGGVYPLSKFIRNSDSYNSWRTTCFQRDSYTCQECNVKGGDLEVHHIKEFSVIFKEFLNQYSQFSPIEDVTSLLKLAFAYASFWELDNGKTLCRTCHEKTFVK